ncbi:MAG: lamin tail domain-containing protein [Muribaculaceae bacterium]|nr:lamin tail domain-containing protein [Muribaculaceae bacterium]
MKKFLLSFSLAAISAMGVGASELVPVLQESFSKCKSSVIQGGYLSEDYYFDATELADNPGWTTQYAYVSERALKFSAKTKPSGYAVTPALEFSTTTAHTVVVRFRAQTWAHKDDKVNVCVQVDGDASTVQKVDADASSCISDRSEEPFQLTFTNVPSGARLRFYPEKKEGAATDRWFLSDVVVLEERDTPSGAALWSSAGYQRFDPLMVGDDSELRTLRIGASGLGADIELEQPEGSAFRVTRGSDWDARRGGTLNVAFDPSLAGVAEEVLTLRSGSAVRPVVLYGASKVYAPVADDATGVASDAFTACWHRVAGLDRIELHVYTKEQAPLVASDLMFTKYIEGKSNNRALEIFNGTGREVSLAGYCLRMESNGAGGLTFGEYAFADDAKIPAGGTFTVCNSNFQALRDIADVTIGFQNGGYANITTFTGDDAIGLFAPDGRLIDLLGYESTDVNDEVNGNWGQDKTFYRKSSCYEPSDKFRPEQWDEYPMDYCEGYGTHTMDATGPVARTVSRLTLERGATSARIEGLPDAGACYYTVQGYSGALKTPMSAEIAVDPQRAGIADAVADAAAAPAVEAVYDLAGRRLAPDARGIVIVRLSDGTARKEMR